MSDEDAYAVMLIIVATVAAAVGVVSLILRHRSAPEVPLVPSRAYEDPGAWLWEIIDANEGWSESGHTLSLHGSGDVFTWSCTTCPWSASTTGKAKRGKMVRAEHEIQWKENR